MTLNSAETNLDGLDVAQLQKLIDSVVADAAKTTDDEASKILSPNRLLLASPHPLSLETMDFELHTMAYDERTNPLPIACVESSTLKPRVLPAGWVSAEVDVLSNIGIGPASSTLGLSDLLNTSDRDYHEPAPVLFSPSLTATRTPPRTAQHVSPPHFPHYTAPYAAIFEAGGGFRHPLLSDQPESSAAPDVNLSGSPDLSLAFILKGQLSAPPRALAIDSTSPHPIALSGAIQPEPTASPFLELFSHTSPADLPSPYTTSWGDPEAARPCSPLVSIPLHRAWADASVPALSDFRESWPRLAPPGLSVSSACSRAASSALSLSTGGAASPFAVNPEIRSSVDVNDDTHRSVGVFPLEGRLPKRKRIRTKEHRPGPKRCPICGSLQQRGDNLKKHQKTKQCRQVSASL